MFTRFLRSFTASALVSGTAALASVLPIFTEHAAAYAYCVHGDFGQFAASITDPAESAVAAKYLPHLENRDFCFDVSQVETDPSDPPTTVIRWYTGEGMEEMEFVEHTTINVWDLLYDVYLDFRISTIFWFF